MMAQSLAGRIAAVTGAGAGIGRASAHALAAEGATVIAADIDEDAARTVAKEIMTAGGQALAVTADVSTASGAEQIAAAARDLGGLDILHNNAGIQRYGTVETTTEVEWDEVIAVNLKSVYLVSHACIPLMRQRGGGSIVNTSSVQGMASQRAVAAYTTSKHGVIGLTRSMALDLAPSIRVNCVCPGAVDTPMLRWALSLAPAPQHLRMELEHMHPLARIAEPEEIAAVVVFLAGSAASFITGAAIPIDGGLLVSLPGSPAAD